MNNHAHRNSTFGSRLIPTTYGEGRSSDDRSWRLKLGRCIGAAAAGFLAALVSTASAHAADRWIMASGYPEGNFMTRNIRIFIDEIKDAGLDIDLKSDGALIRLESIKAAVQRGQVQIGDVRLGVHGNEDPMLDLAGVPFVAPDYATLWLLKDIQKDYLEKWFSGQGMRLLFQMPWPGSGFYTKTPVNSLQDIQGQKLRIYSVPTQKMGDMLGFQATILPFAEVPQAFSTGLIDAMFTSPQTGIDIQAWDTTRYFTYVGATLATNAVFVNEAAYQALPEATRQIILDAARRAELRGWEMSAATTTAQMKILEDNGITLNPAPEDLVQQLNIAGEALMKDWRALASPEANSVLDRYLSLR